VKPDSCDSLLPPRGASLVAENPRLEYALLDSSRVTPLCRASQKGLHTFMFFRAFVHLVAGSAPPRLFKPQPCPTRSRSLAGAITILTTVLAPSRTCIRVRTPIWQYSLNQPLADIPPLNDDATLSYPPPLFRCATALGNSLPEFHPTLSQRIALSPNCCKTPPSTLRTSDCSSVRQFTTSSKVRQFKPKRSSFFRPSFLPPRRQLSIFLLNKWCLRGADACFCFFDCTA